PVAWNHRPSRLRNRSWPAPIRSVAVTRPLTARWSATRYAPAARSIAPVVRSLVVPACRIPVTAMSAAKEGFESTATKAAAVSIAAPEDEAGGAPLDDAPLAPDAGVETDGTSEAAGVAEMRGAWVGVVSPHAATSRAAASASAAARGMRTATPL